MAPSADHGCDTSLFAVVVVVDVARVLRRCALLQAATLASVGGPRMHWLLEEHMSFWLAWTKQALKTLLR